MILDVHGVGYEVFVPLGAALPESTTLYVHTHVREDALQLFGFVSACETRSVRGEPACTDSQPCDVVGNNIGEA